MQSSSTSRHFKVSKIVLSKLIPFKTFSNITPSIEKFPFKIELKFFYKLMEICFAGFVELIPNFFLLFLWQQLILFDPVIPLKGLVVVTGIELIRTFLGQGSAKGSDLGLIFKSKGSSSIWNLCHLAPDRADLAKNSLRPGLQII